MLEMDRILRPNGFIIFREHDALVSFLEATAVAFHWELKAKKSESGGSLLAYVKTFWRPAT